MSTVEFPRGNNFNFVLGLNYKVDGVTTPVSDLATANDVVVNIGPDPQDPETVLNLASGQVAIDTPTTGKVTVTLLSTDTIDMSLGNQKVSIQVKYLANDENNVEWPVATAFKFKANNVPPLSA